MEQYNSNEKQQANIILTGFSDEVTAIVKEVGLILKTKDNIISILGKEAEPFFEIISNLLDDVESENTKLQEKIEKINDNIECDITGLASNIDEMSKSISTIMAMKITKSKEIEEKISKLSILIKGSIGLELKQNSLIIKNLKLIEEKSIQLETSKKANEDILSKVEELKRSKSNTGDFANHISKILAMIEVNLKLEVFEDDYIIKNSVSDDTLRLEDISEGEQNLLALLYFYYELFEDDEQKLFKSAIELIIIDDPISSVDDVNKMYVLELIKSMLLTSQPQIFVFTHVWEDFCNLCYGKKDRPDTDYRFYEIKKNENSHIITTKTNETPYQHGFKEIYDFSQKANCDGLSDCEIYHYPNVMRKILEEYLGFKIKNNSPTADNFNNVLNVLCGDSPTDNDKLRLGTLLSVCNVLSHKASRTPDEILKSSKFLMNKIKDRDKLHYDTMKA